MTAPDIQIRPTGPEDWERVRDLRLEALADTPGAFGDTLPEARAQSEAYWRARAGRGITPGRTGVAAIHGGRWVGTMAGVIEAEAGALLVSVYVTPAYRGRTLGVTGALLRAVEDWARTVGDTLSLHVHADNARARAFYEREGFHVTGREFPETAISTRQLEMLKRL